MSILRIIIVYVVRWIHPNARLVFWCSRSQDTRYKDTIVVSLSYLGYPIGVRLAVHGVFRFSRSESCWIQEHFTNHRVSNNILFAIYRYQLLCRTNGLFWFS